MNHTLFTEVISKNESDGCGRDDARLKMTVVVVTVTMQSSMPSFCEADHPA